MIVLSVAILVGCADKTLVEATQQQAPLSPIQVPVTGPVADNGAETLVAAWNDTRPYVNVRTEVVQIGDGAFELRYGAIDGKGSADGQALVEVDAPSGRRFNVVEARNGDYFELLEGGAVRVGDNDGVLYTKKTLVD
jgi:hypothetical protein